MTKATLADFEPGGIAEGWGSDLVGALMLLFERCLDEAIGECTWTKLLRRGVWMKAALVVGHKPSSPGATNKAEGLSEYDFNWELAELIQ